MNADILQNIMYLRLKSGADVDITVTGVSMEPSLREGDVVTVRRADSYDVGDILVFRYKSGELLIHRLLLINDGRYFCKGDNALRLEDVEYGQIAGKVIKRNGEEPLALTTVGLELSYLISRVFRKSGYDASQTKQSGIYRFYKQYINQTEDKTMTYQKSKAMDYISPDETSLAVFDPESGDTHFYNETGVDILGCMDEPVTLDELLDKLCEIYDATPEDIRADVEDFLADCIAKNVVIVR
ncbi:MAG: HPr-rel-A system PqqD family peptide chaperone [Clostridia bacterium]|nr:HPr-rel-A system PqqD family peptide chaperone [Clostridia bacterium]